MTYSHSSFIRSASRIFAAFLLVLAVKTIFAQAIFAQQPSLQVSVSRLELGFALPNTLGIPFSYTVSGQNLTSGAVTITAPQGVVISTIQNGLYSSSLSLLPQNGTLSPTIIYVRLLFSDILSVAGDITHQNGSASTSLRITGTVQSLENGMSPLVPSPQTLTFGTVLVGSVVRARTYTLMGNVPSGSVVSIVAPTGVEISRSANGPFTSLLRLTASQDRISDTIYVRLLTAVPIREFGTSITNTFNNTSVSVRIVGSIITQPVPQLSAQPDTVRFDSIPQSSSFPIREYRLTGSNLSAPIQVEVDASDGVQVQNPITGQWERSFTLFPDINESTNQTLRVRISNTITLGALQTLIRHSSGSMARANVIVTANVVTMATTTTGNMMPPVIVPPSPLPEFVATPNTLVFPPTFVGDVTVPLIYRLTGRNLVSTTVTITAPSGVEISDSANVSFTNRLTFNVGSSFSRPILVRLVSTQARTFSNAEIKNDNSIPTWPTSATVVVSGEIRRRPAVLTATPNNPQLTGANVVVLETTVQFEPSIPSTYTLTGENLVAPVIITAPAGILLFSATTGTWTNSLVLATSATGSLMQTMFVRMDSSILRLYSNAEISHTSGSSIGGSSSTQATAFVSGNVISLFLPSDAETTLSLRLLTPRQPLRFGDTARVQVWLANTRMTASQTLAPRIIGRFMKNLRFSVRTDTNNLALVGIRPNAALTRAQLELPEAAPHLFPTTTFRVERVDTSTTTNFLLAELLYIATLAKTATNTIRLVSTAQSPTVWLDGGLVPTLAKIRTEPDSLRVDIVPLFAPRKTSATASIGAENNLVLSPNPIGENGMITISYKLHPASVQHETSLVRVVVSDVTGKIVQELQLGERTTGQELQETLSLCGLAAGAYNIVLIAGQEIVQGRVDVRR